MSNAWGTKTTQQLVNAVNVVHSHVPAAPNNFGFSADQLSAALQAAEFGATAILSQDNALAAMKRATEDKTNAKRELVLVLANLVATAEANGNVSDAMLMSIGFSPRRAKGSRQTAPPVPTDIKVVPQVDGAVSLGWSRNGASASTIYQVETSADGLDFSIVTSTVRKSLVLDGYVPGTQAWFRITAINSAGQSRPSANVPIYAPAPAAVQLRVA